MKWYNKPAGDGCLQEVFAGGAMNQWLCCILYLGQAPRHAEWKYNIWNFM